MLTLLSLVSSLTDHIKQTNWLFLVHIFYKFNWFLTEEWTFFLPLLYSISFFSNPIHYIFNLSEFIVTHSLVWENDRKNNKWYSQKWKLIIFEWNWMKLYIEIWSCHYAQKQFSKHASIDIKCIWKIRRLQTTIESEKRTSFILFFWF